MHSAGRDKQNRLIEKLKRELGKSILAALEDPDIIEVFLNDDGKVWYDSLEKGMSLSGETIESMRAYNIICTVASLRNRNVNEAEVSVECTLPIDGSRFTAVIPEAVSNACFNIRKKALRVFTLEDYARKKILSTKQADVLRTCINENLSILIVGGPGTGKTTFANALLNEMVLQGNPEQRFVIIEETPELQCSAKNKISIRTTEHFGFVRALRHALVSRPDKICLGECRGAEVLTLLKAWNTGTKGGLSTLHANNASTALSRIAGMIEENEGIRAQNSFIADAVDVICAMSFHSDTGRKVTEILKVIGFENNSYVFQQLDS